MAHRRPVPGAQDDGNAYRFLWNNQDGTAVCSGSERQVHGSGLRPGQVHKGQTYQVSPSPWASTWRWRSAGSLSSQ